MSADMPGVRNLRRRQDGILLAVNVLQHRLVKGEGCHGI
jgi:hypothetical protein